MEHPKSYIFLDTFTSPGIEETIDGFSNKYGMQGKIMFASRSQIAQIMRFTYDGLVTTPQESIHTSLYGEEGYRFNPKTERLDNVLETIRRRNVKEIFQPQLENSQLNKQLGGI